MQSTFSHLVKRSLNLKQSTVGDPLEVLPVKNSKNAKNCIEVHLADRELQELINFDKFPNLECLWLNNNKLEKIEGLDTNFRLRELYLQNNKLNTLQGSLINLVHLRTLDMRNNEIRDLDKALETLKDFKQLYQLDMSENPVAEEPNYRLRVIIAVPSLHVLDSHVVTTEEKTKAKLWYNTEVKGIEPPKKAKKAGAWQTSQSEKILDKEAKNIKEKIIQQGIDKENAEKNEIIDRFSKWHGLSKAPISQYLVDNKAKLAALPITEWEKNYLLPLFKAYDKEKKGNLKYADAQNLYKDLVDDKGCIGMIPHVSLEEFYEKLKLSNTNPKENAIHWNDFRIRINDLKWGKADEQKTQDRINNYYKEANKLIMSGKSAQAPELLNKASRLENAMSK